MQIAWSPLRTRRKLFLLAVLCPANQKMDRQTYLSYLGHRVQRMVNKSPDPKAAVKALQTEMFRTGLVRETGYCPMNEAGSRLVTYNPTAYEKVSNLGAFKSLASKPQAAATDSLEARNAMSPDCDSPQDSLLNWATQMGAVV